MEQQGVPDSQDQTYDAPSLSYQGASLDQQPTKDQQDVSRPNDHAQSGEKGNAASDVAKQKISSNQVGKPSLESASDKKGDVVPALDQSWRDTDANKSMGVLVERLAQQCYSDLNETLTKIAEIPVEPQTNGVLNRTNDVVEGSLTKKRLFMDFANNQRDRFIKTLVLSDWARNGEDMARLVDIKVWQEKQARGQRDAIQFIGITKHDTQAAKMPSPNIEGALEFLATGKVSQFPDMGYLPPKRLSARQLLKTLRNMNVILATRLNLHEELPLYFNDFTVANGRATFKVAGEFEVDLSVADEDEKSPFYFIDFRFLFTPSSSVLNEGLRAELEGRCNGILAASGLQGCYEFLHNFVLTHKIHMLRNQAATLIGETWFDCLRIDKPPRGRALILHYWASLSGSKSWIEIGVTTGKARDNLSPLAPTPKLTLRWIKEKHAQVDDFEIDWRQLSVEQCLTAVIARHSSSILQKIADDLRSLAGTNSQLDVQLTTSDSTPEDCSLTLYLKGMREPIQVRIEPMTGRFYITPTSSFFARVESRLTESGSNSRDNLAHILCRSVQERAAKAAELAGWSLPPAVPSGNPPALFGPSILYRSVYVCSKSWGSNWAVVATFGLEGQKWWIVQLECKQDERGMLNIKFASKPCRIPAQIMDGADSTLSQASLAKIEKLAVAEISYTVLAQELTTLQIPHRVEKLIAPPLEAAATSIAETPVPMALFFRSVLMRSATDSRTKPAGTVNIVRVTSRGALYQEKNGKAVAEMCHEVRLSLAADQLKYLRHYLSRHRDCNIALDKSGALAVRIRTPFGQTYYKYIQEAVAHVERLNGYLRIVAQHRFKIRSLSFSSLSFSYGRNQNFSATLTFLKLGDSPTTKLKFEPKDLNPHQRIRLSLERGTNVTSPVAFLGLIRTLSLTLPLLHTLDTLETSPQALKQNSVVIHAQRLGLYQLRYKYPFPPVAFTVNLCSKVSEGKQSLIWQIAPSSPSSFLTSPPAHNGTISTSASKPEPYEELKSALRDEFFKHAGDNQWWGLGGVSVLARPSGISQALTTLNTILLRYEGQFAALLPTTNGDNTTHTAAAAASHTTTHAAAATAPHSPPTVTKPEPTARPPPNKKPPAPPMTAAPAPKHQPPQAAQMRKQPSQQQQQQQQPPHPRPPQHPQLQHNRHNPIPIKREDVIELD